MESRSEVHWFRTCQREGVGVRGGDSRFRQTTWGLASSGVVGPGDIITPGQRALGVRLRPAADLGCLAMVVVDALMCVRLGHLPPLAVVPRIDPFTGTSLQTISQVFGSVCASLFGRAPCDLQLVRVPYSPSRAPHPSLALDHRDASLPNNEVLDSDRRKTVAVFEPCRVC